MKMKENKILGMIPVTVFSGEEEGGNKYLNILKI